VINVAAKQGQSILIIDDDTSVVLALQQVLQSFGRIFFASCAEEALAMVKVNPPDVILLDVELPDKSGLEVCAELKADPQSQAIPVLFITSLTEPGFEEQVFAVGAEDYISKPLNPRVVAARVGIQVAHQRALRTLEQLAHLDGLTGLANRRRFDEFLEAELRRCSREPMPISLLMIDIDHFKHYNDHFGHLAGDDCIKQVARLLETHVQRAADFVARYGGEEFAVVLPGTSRQRAEALAGEIQLAMQRLSLEHAPTAAHPVVTLSIGVCTMVASAGSYPERNASAIVDGADQALYQCKRSGRHCVRSHDFAGQPARGHAEAG
jgi:diguanylate cyclase (GGDEF)-like protein